MTMRSLLVGLAVAFLFLAPAGAQGDAAQHGKTTTTPPAQMAQQKPRSAPAGLLAVLTDPGLAPIVLILILLILALVAPFYFLPALIAYHRVHPKTRAVFFVNLLLGWTVLGWIGALVWAVRGSNPYPHFAARRS